MIPLKSRRGKLLPTVLRFETIELDLGFFDGHQPGLDVWFDQGKELFQFILCIHDLDDDGQVFGERIEAEGLDVPCIRTETHHAAQDGRSCQPLFTRLQNDPLIERFALNLVRFADEDTEQSSILWQLHGYTPLRKHQPRRVTKEHKGF